MEQTSKVERARMALAQNEADWKAAWDRVDRALHSGENYERWMKVADSFARAAAVVRERLAELELDAAFAGAFA